MQEEKFLGQRFLVDVTVYLDLRPAGESDNLREGVDYTEIYRTVKALVEGEKLNLIEALAERIASEILTELPRIDQVTVAVAKPEVPIPGIINEVEVEVTRRRSK
ncbi:hypothetical protein SY88_20940 [Clostridiales bacterium PH28_bin88]|nr:hypothetical protein SY88_20940 [Clostridiales bacterium PH28_bin88]